MNPVIYFRPDISFDEEREAIEKWFTCVPKRTDIPANSLVIPRYSALPYNKELCEDLETLGSVPINTYREHCYVSDLRNWYYDLGDVTPRTWFALDQIPTEGPFVLKGQTNSKKFQWNTHMFAEDKYEAGDVFARLASDGHVGHQQIYVRKYEPLTKLAQGLNGLPITEEYRFFVLDGQIVDAGFYWSSHTDDLKRKYDPFVEVPEEFTQKVIEKIKNRIRFWVFDVARKADGEWIVIELNDGQQSGLSEIDPDRFYRNLRNLLEETPQ
jgi:hypothetical protein